MLRCKFAIVAALLCLMGSAVLAQETRGTIVGRVSDATGAVVPNADVQVKNQAMGTVVSLKTNESGAYTAPLLIPGMYQVTISAPGFKQFVRSDIQLRVADRIEVNASLEVGGATETVTVAGTPELLSTETASKGSVITQEQIRDLPLSYGNPFGLISVTSGVGFTGSVRLDRPFEPSHIANYSINGSRGLRSDITLDGAPATSTANALEVIASYVPPTDALAEFKVQTATFDAASGFTEAGVTNLSIKSGSNAFHGTAYYGWTRKDFWANDFFTNKLGNPRPDFKFDRWGGSIGGPVWLPKIYDGRNKTFFFFDEEGIHDSRPRYDQAGNPQVPTDAMKSGDFSSLLTAGGSSYQIYNPYTRSQQANGQIAVQPFPGNIIPSNLIDPVGAKILSYWGPASSPGDSLGRNNLLKPDLAEKAKYYNFTTRIDQNIGDKNRLYGRYSQYIRNSTYNNYFGDDNPAAGVLFNFSSYNGVIDDTIVASPTLVFDLRYGYNRFIRWQDGNPAAKGFDLTALGFPAELNNAIPEERRRFPRIDLSGYIGNGIGGEFRPTDTHSLSAAATKTAGTHSIRAGVEFRAYRETSVQFGNDASGRYNFDGATVRGPLISSPGTTGNIGQSAAALLLGIPSANNSYINVPAGYAEQSTVWGMYIQDDWKVTPKLTLNLGLRYEVEGALTERFNRTLKSFDPTYIQPLNDAAVDVYNTISGLGRTEPFIVRGATVYATPGSSGDPLYHTPKLNLMPRFGFAYQLLQNTVIRGGFGQYSGFLGQRRGDVYQPGYSQATPFNAFAEDNITVVRTLSNPFPDGIIAPTGASRGAQTLLGQNVTAFNQNPDIPNIYRWQFDVQHQLPGSFLVEAGYVGNKSINVEVTRNINALPNHYLSTLGVRDNELNTFMTGQVANPFFGLMPNTAGGTYTAEKIQRQYLLLPFPGYGDINITTNEGYSWYHSFQLRVEKRFSYGLTLMGNYTFSKFMQATELLNDGDPAPTRMISDQDIPHRIAIDWVYELPFGKGKPVLGNAGGLLDKFIGGWEFTGVWARQTGFPIQFNSNDFFLQAPASAISLGPNEINTAAFVTASSQQPVFHLRNQPFRFPNVRGPVINNIDVSVLKDTKFGERHTLRFSVQALNAFNHPLLPTVSGNIRSSSFGVISGSTQNNYPRRLQMEIKYIF